VALPLTLDKDINRVLALRGQGETDEWWPETGLNRRRRPFQGRLPNGSSRLESADMVDRMEVKVNAI